jgi:hypothetical protein
LLVLLAFLVVGIPCYGLKRTWFSSYNRNKACSPSKDNSVEMLPFIEI